MVVRINEAVVWVKYISNDRYRRPCKVMIWPHSKGAPMLEDGACWCDPIGAAYMAWRKASNEQRKRLLVETAIDLAMQGLPLKQVLVEFSEIPEFLALGAESYPMCRALTRALLGISLESGDLSFWQLLERYTKDYRLRQTTQHLLGEQALEMWETGYPTFDDIVCMLNYDDDDETVRQALRAAWRKKHPRGRMPTDFYSVDEDGAPLPNQ